MNKPIFKPLALAVGLALGAAGCSHGQQQSAPKQAAAKPAKPAATAASKAPAKPIFDVSELDTKVSPCDNLNTFVNAKWIAANPIPADHTSWGSFVMLYEKSLKDQHSIVESAAKNAASAKQGSIEQKIGDLYNLGMDQAKIDKAGFDPIKPYLADIDHITSRKDIGKFLTSDFAMGSGQVFGLYGNADFRDATKQIAYVSQSGLGLPTPDYYTKKEYAPQRKAYKAYIAKTLELTGVSKADATHQADQVMTFETSLAKASLSRVALRNPKNQYNFVSLKQAQKVTPHFDWARFFKAQGADIGKGFSLSQPKFFVEFDHLLAHAPLSEWKAYLRFHTIDDAAPYLSKAFVDANFDFYGKTLNGQPQQRPRWKRVLGAVNGAMGQALGQLYVAKYFPPEAKKRAEVLVKNVRLALKHRIENVDWMSEATKKKALQKWAEFLPKIGYPDHWRSWQGLSVDPQHSYYANLMAAAKFNHAYRMAKIGKPTDRHDWEMTPQTVNAYYDPTNNTINFPAAILQPPFFYAHGDDAINYGGIGAVIGHESSHGFDDEGRQFDGHGNLHNWWTKADLKQFKARTAKLVAQFNGYHPFKDQPKVHVNGELTLGENIADLGGLNVAYDALQMALKRHPKEAAEKIGGYTQDQRFFMNWARVWRGEIREKAEEVRLNTDPHSPVQFRAIGAPSNMPAFAQAFKCKAGDPMVRSGDKQVKIW